MEIIPEIPYLLMVIGWKQKRFHQIKENSKPLLNSFEYSVIFGRIWHITIFVKF